MEKQKSPALKGGHAVRTTGLTKKYGDFTAVRDLDLTVGRGIVYGLLGPNGSGKTTIIRILSGLLEPTGGETEVLGKRLPDRSVAGRVGYMPQETALYLDLTIHQHIGFFGTLFGLDGERIAAREKELLRVIGLEKWRDTLVANLSGGMKHRVSLACALLHEPELLFLDEPTVGVDPELRASFWAHFRKLKERGSTILITTHYMDEARHCDRIGFMREGSLIAEGTPEELLLATGTDSLEDAFLRSATGVAETWNRSSMEFAVKGGGRKDEGGGDDE